MKYFTVDSYVFRECAEGHEKDSHVSGIFNYLVENICDPLLSTFCQILGWMDGWIWNFKNVSLSLIIVILQLKCTETSYQLQWIDSGQPYSLCNLIEPFRNQFYCFIVSGEGNFILTTGDPND
jgi:hypothetical protein